MATIPLPNRPAPAPLGSPMAASGTPAAAARMKMAAPTRTLSSTNIQYSRRRERPWKSK